MNFNLWVTNSHDKTERYIPEKYVFFNQAQRAENLFFSLINFYGLKIH